MSCAHCGANCTESGNDMTMETFEQALRFADYCDSEGISLGGGEPTIHPLFWQFFGMSFSVGTPWLATNCSMTDITLKLIKMAQKDCIGLRLSMDHWHDDVADEIHDAIEYMGNIYPNKRDGMLEVVKHIENVTAVGRGKNIIDSKEGCLCPSIIIQPDGSIKQCGCEDAPIIGTVYDLDLQFEFNCHKDIELYQEDVA